MSCFSGLSTTIYRSDGYQNSFIWDIYTSRIQELAQEGSHKIPAMEDESINNNLQEVV